MEAPDILLQRLAEAGAIAVYTNCNTEAAKIYEAIAAWKPNAAVAYLGLAMNYQAKGDMDGAIKVLEKAVAGASADNPKKDLLKSVLALYLKIAGQSSRSEQLRNEILQNSKDPEALALIQDFR
jgi:tetratricopeptide (TPR) repeat protein